MDEFWRAWAAYQVKTQWDIYCRPKPFPGVESIETELEPIPAFVIVTKDGCVFRLQPSGIARLVGRNGHAVR